MKTRVLLLPFLGTCLLLAPTAARAWSPYTTWVQGPGGYLYFSQDAYTPEAEIPLPISWAEDMFVSPDGTFYIADTGNGQILKLKDFQVVASYGGGVLSSPTGVVVDPDGTLYVADAGTNTIVILDPDGTLVGQFGRPDEPLFGLDREFLPRKLAVDVRRNIYIVGEGSVNGIIQMNVNGGFIGYFGANPAAMSLKMILQRLLLTREQLAQYILNEAASPSNIAIDGQSMVYTITAGTDRYQSLRKFTISGRNIFPDAFGSTNFRDIDVSDNGLVLAVDSGGRIYEYDQSGFLLFVFGAQDTGDQRLGTLRNPSAIERHGDHLYVLDADKDAIVVYRTTAFAQMVHSGVRLYVEGFYADAQPYFEQVLNYDGSFLMAYRAIGDAEFYAGEYASALAAYRYGEDRAGYSQAFWELRNAVLQRTLAPAILWGLAAWLVLGVFTRLERRRGWLAPARAWLKGLQRFRRVDDLVFLFRFIKQPADSFYYIKKKQRGSLTFAFLVYAWVVVVRLLSLYLTGYAFSPYPSTSWIYPESEVLKALLLIFLWNAANYLVSTISDGEGRVRDVIIASAYSLFPYALFALPIALVSNLLTHNEVFIYTFSLDLMWFWVGLMLFLMVKEIHNYSFKETVRNVLLTLFTMGLFVLTGYILYVLFSQLYDFVSAILQEVGLRG